MPGKMRDFIADLGENHRVFPLTKYSDKRFAWHDLAALVTCLEIAQGSTDIKAPSLTRMYKEKQEFDSNGKFAKKVKRNLKYMEKVLKSRPPEMSIKWGFVDLYFLISQMDELYIIKDREADFTDFYVAFERDRLEAGTDPSELLTSGEDCWDKDLYDYIEAFVREGGTKRNIEKRHQVYKNRFLKGIQDLVPKDPQRSFTTDERIIIWRRDNESCQMCKNKIELDDMHADHILPYSKGGETTLDNAQTLCKLCNTKKGAA